MEKLHIGASDVVAHTVTFGVDVYPSIDIYAERTRLHMFYEEARSQLGELYTKLTESDSQFEVSHEFRKGRGGSPATASTEVFVLTNRGPVFKFPILIPETGDTGLAADYVELFHQSRQLFLKHLPGRVCLRVGMVREAVFNTGRTQPFQVVARAHEIQGATMVGGMLGMGFIDPQCNVRLELQTVQFGQITQVAGGHPIAKAVGNGLGMLLDVNNREVRTLTEGDIETILARAHSFWPDSIVEFINERV